LKPTINDKQLSKIYLKGFKSIADCELELGSLNILVGCNGAGKTNFIGFFKMIQQMLNNSLQLHVGRGGGPDAFLHFGRQKTHSIQTRLYFGKSAYTCELESTQDNRLMFLNESIGGVVSGFKSIGKGHFETKVFEGKKTKKDRCVLDAIRDWKIYHFHDTSDTAKVKQLNETHDNEYLRPDGQNLAAYLYFLQKKYKNQYSMIIKTIKLVMPFFKEFYLRPSVLNEDKIELMWYQEGENSAFRAHQLSDGTLRFISLTTLLTQPSEKLPETIILDEPELGLHPFAIVILGAMIRSVSKKKQVIVATQSVELLNEFDPEDVIVVDRNQGASTFRRIQDTELTLWLEEYTLGELWQKNIFGGSPGK